MPKRLISKTSITPNQIISDLLQHTKEVGDCLIWKGAKATDGYATMYPNIKVHRKIASLFYGKDIDGLVVRHTCDNPLCINPKHLILGTVLDNVRDRDERGRTHKVITKEIVIKVRALLETNLLQQKEIAQIIGINPRRVSDISRKLYSPEGKFLGRL